MKNPLGRLWPFNRKVSRTSQLMVGSGPSINARWSDKRYDVFAEESYLTNVVSYRCIEEVARSVASVPWEVRHVLRDGTYEPAPNDPFMNVLKRPNPDDSFPFLVLKLMAYLQIAGNSYIERVGPTTGPNMGMPKELYVLRPDRITVNIDKNVGRIGGYTYEIMGKSVEFKIDPITGRGDLLHLKQFHPLNDWYGKGNVEPTAREIDTSNEAANWNKRLLEKECRPGLVFTITNDMNFMVTKEQLDDLDKKLKEKFSSGPGENLILSGARGTSVAPYGFSPRDMDWEKGDDRIARRICMGFGVPPMIVGIPGEATFANFKEARLFFWETTILWFVEFLRQEWNNWLFSEDPETELHPVLDDVPALSDRRDALWTRAEGCGDFLTVNERREMVGYGPYEPDESDPGSMILQPATNVPLGTEPVVEEPPDGGFGNEGEEE